MAELKLPELGENIVQGTLTKILVKPGDAIKKGQNILELETDKAVLEVPSNTDGVVGEILVKTGTVIKVGQPIFKIETSAATDKTPAAPAPTAKAEAPSAVIPESSNRESKSEAAVSGPPTKAFGGDKIAPAAKQIPVRKDIPAAPSVRLFSREICVDLGQVTGSGVNGRISVEDVKKFAKSMLSSGVSASGGGIIQQPLPNFSKWGTVRREPMNNVRKKTAEHLSYAWNSIPHVTQFDKADITELEKLRKRFTNDKRKLSITPFLIKVIAAGLKQFPQFNTSVDMSTSEVIYKDYINVGVAVDTDRGLIVPVLKNVDKMSILQISDELTGIAERARTKKTTIEEMQGGCFTISNLGGIGGTFFTPIVNTPEVAILGVSRGVMEPVYMENQFVPRLMLPLSLSYDHRIIDGADGARFIRWVADAIQQPFLMDLKQ